MTGIIQRNLPLLGANIHSYEQQIRSAFRRRDRVSLNHRTAAWLASYFDILFAANRRFNPGREAPARAGPSPAHRARGGGRRCGSRLHGSLQLDRCVVDHLERMRTRLERFLRIQGLL